MPSGTADDAWNEPSDYERWYGSALGRAYLASLERVLPSWVAATRSPSALDIGCGPGLVARQLFPPEMLVVGVDCSAEMARRAREHARLVGQPQRVVAGSVEALPFAAGAFPLALCVNCLEFVDDRERAFGEIARILAPGGTAIVGVLNRHSAWELTRRLRRIVSNSPYYEGRFFTRDELCGHLDTAGFDVEDVELAVRFPPLPGSLVLGLCRAMDRLGRRWAPARGAVILCRAVKRARGTPEPPGS